MPWKIFDSHFCRRTASAGVALVVAGLFVVTGCSSGTSAAKPLVGAIAFTDVNATVQKPLTSLAVSQGTYLDVTLTSDPKLLGADWTVVCGSALPPGTPLPPGQTQDQSCGTFTPAHTIGAPVPSYATSAAGYVTFYTAPAVPPKQGIVTLYASATSDPSKFTTVTLTISGFPISIGFAPAPPSTLGLSTGTQFKAVVNNDATGAGVNWTVVCGSSACGSFSPAQTASGVVTTYTSPSIVPPGGTVKLTATSIADPTKSTSATIQIAPISVSVTAAAPSVSTSGTGTLTATVVNDGLNKGVDWTVSCTNTVTPGVCGSITSHTASGATATYTAPSVANIAAGSAITLTATSTTDPTKSASSSVTITKGSLVSGTLQAAQRPVSHGQVTLYAAQTNESALNSSVNAKNVSATTTAITDQDGNFSIPYGYECPTPGTQMYLVSAGGDAGGGTNPNLSLIAALGSCEKLDASRFVVDEATTVAAIYALSGFMADVRHIGSGMTTSTGLTTAFATANDLVDVTTGSARQQTEAGAGVVPQAKINMLANLVGACARTAGLTEADENSCGLLFRATNPATTPATEPNDTAQALLNLARNATGFANAPSSFATLYKVATSNSFLNPALSAEPSDWTLMIEFPTTANKPSALSANSAKVSVDPAGNVWIRGSGTRDVEFVGAAWLARANNLIPLAIAPGRVP